MRGDSFKPLTLQYWSRAFVGAEPRRLRLKILVIQKNQQLIPYTVIMLVAGDLRAAVHSGHFSQVLPAARHAAAANLRGAFQYGCLHGPQGSGPGADSGSLWHAFRCVDGAHVRGVRVASLCVQREPGTMLGAMLAASDPVPVLAGMTVSGADRRLITFTSAESIINDGPGVLLFSPFRWGDCRGRGIHAGERVSFIAQSTLVAALLCWCSLLRLRADVEAVREGDGRRFDARHHGPLLGNTCT